MRKEYLNQIDIVLEEIKEDLVGVYAKKYLEREKGKKKDLVRDKNSVKTLPVSGGVWLSNEKGGE